MPPFSHLLATCASLVSLAVSAPAPTSSGILGLSLPTPPGLHNIDPITIQQLQKRMPLDGLPSNSNVTLLYSALGIGHQNYTCDNGLWVQTQQGDGASALLYDTTWFLEHNPQYISHLTKYCNYQHCQFPQIFLGLLGDHYFSEAIQPTFNLTRANPIRVMSGIKDDAENSPNDPTGSVPWLFLTANPTNGISQGLTEVYRIDTYQGKAPTSCSQSAQTTSIPYSAQYWFFN